MATLLQTSHFIKGGSFLASNWIGLPITCPLRSANAPNAAIRCLHDFRCLVIPALLTMALQKLHLPLDAPSSHLPNTHFVSQHTFWEHSIV